MCAVLNVFGIMEALSITVRPSVCPSDHVCQLFFAADVKARNFVVE